MTIFQTRFNNKIKQQIEFNEDSLTEQNHYYDSLTTTIINKHKQVGIDLFRSQIDINQDGVLDFTQATDFHDYQNKIAQAQSSFESLPAILRKRFGNNSMNMLKFLQDPKNLNEAIELGLVNKPISKQNENEIKKEEKTNNETNNKSAKTDL